MIGSIPTIKIKNPKGEGYVSINESDFNPEEMELWQDKPASAPEKEEEPEDVPTDFEGLMKHKGGKPFLLKTARSLGAETLKGEPLNVDAKETTKEMIANAILEKQATGDEGFGEEDEDGQDGEETDTGLEGAEGEKTDGEADGADTATENAGGAGGGPAGGVK